MHRRHVTVTATTRAPAAAVYALLADGPSWPTWSPIDEIELERPGNPPAEGVGAIRVLHRGRTTGRDEIRELVPNRRFAYATLSGVPVRDYLGEVDLAEADGETTIRWHSSFLPRVYGTGWLVQWGIHRFLDLCVHGLVQHAATVTAPGRSSG